MKELIEQLDKALGLLESLNFKNFDRLLPLSLEESGFFILGRVEGIISGVKICLESRKGGD